MIPSPRVRACAPDECLRVRQGRTGRDKKGRKKKGKSERKMKVSVMRAEGVRGGGRGGGSMSLHRLSLPNTLGPHAEHLPEPPPPSSHPYSILPEKNKKELTTEAGQQPRCQRFSLTMSKGAEKKGRRRERERKRTNKGTERRRGER